MLCFGVVSRVHWFSVPIGERKLRVFRYALAALSLLWMGACDDAYPGLPHRGTSGQVVAMRFIGGIPVVASSVATQPEQGLVVDTGSPLTLLSAHVFSSDQTSDENATLSTFGMSFGPFPIPVVPLFDANSACIDEVPAGLIGADLLGGFRLFLDYGSGEAALAGPDAAVADPIDLAALGDGDVIPFQLLGGGRLALGGIDRPIGATRIVVPVEVEGRSELALLDTGSTFTVLSQSLFDALEQQGRPSICCRSITLASASTVDASLTRVRSLRLGTIEVERVAASVLPDAVIFAALRQETGQPVSLILGSTVLRRWALEIDYAARSLRLVQHDDVAAETNAFVLPGFDFCQARDPENGMVVTEVFEGTDAAQQQVRAGDLLVGVGGEDLRGLDRSRVLALLRQTTVGQTARLVFRTSRGLLTQEIAMEDLLPVSGW